MNLLRHLLVARLRRLSLPAFVWLTLPVLIVIGICQFPGRPSAANGAPIVLALRNDAAEAELFNETLRDGYADLARKMAGGASRSDGDYFRSKATAAARGDRPAPEAIEAWSLTAESARQMTGLRDRLIRLLDRIHTNAPLYGRRAADLQVAFDCRLAAAEIGAKADALSCSADFLDALRALERDVADDEASKYPTANT